MKEPICKHILRPVGFSDGQSFVGQNADEVWAEPFAVMKCDECNTFGYSWVSAFD